MRNTTSRFASWALCVLVVVSAFGAQAQGAASPLTFTNAVFHEVSAKGPGGKVTKKLVPVAHAVPGDEVIYEIAYKNNGKDTASDIAINNPLPKEVVFLGASVEPTEVSVDGGKQFGQLSRLTVTSANGTTRPALASDVTNLRWIISSLAGGAGGKVTFRARVK